MGSMSDMHQPGMHHMGEGHHERMQAMHDTDAAVIDTTAILQAYAEAIDAEDMVAMEALVLADERFSVIEGGHANWGWVDYRDNHLGPEFASERISFHTYGYSDINVRVGHVFAYATFSYAFEATLDGEPYNKEGLGTAVLRRTADGWRITHLQTS